MTIHSLTLQSTNTHTHKHTHTVLINSKSIYFTSQTGKTVQMNAVIPKRPQHEGESLLMVLYNP